MRIIVTGVAGFIGYHVADRLLRDGAAAGSTSGTYLVGLDRVDGVWKLSRIPDLPS